MGASWGYVAWLQQGLGLRYRRSSRRCSRLETPPNPHRHPTPAPPPPPPSFVYEMTLARPVWRDVMAGFVPTGQIFTDPSMLTIAIGILGVSSRFGYELTMPAALCMWQGGSAQRGAV
jgi:hypothetical protein